MNEEETLALANALIAWGVPVIVCKPRGHEVVPVVAWRSITDAARCRQMLRTYEHGTDALALIGGHGIDLVDVDTKAGGSVDPLGVFEHFGVTRTPSGGLHYVVSSTGLRRIQGLEVEGRPVGDYVGGTAAREGRMLGFLPGSHRPKYPGRPYVMQEPWDVEGAALSASDARLREVLERAAPAERPPEPVDDGPERDPADGLHPQAKADVREVLDGLDRLGTRAWVPGSYWDDATFKAACKLIRLANSGWSGYSVEEAEADLLAHAPRDDKWGRREHLQKWAAARNTVGVGGWPLRLSAADDFDAGSGGGAGDATEGQPKTPPLAVRLRERVQAEHEVFPAGDDGRVFARPRAGGRAELLTANYVIRAARGIGSQMGSLSASATEAAKVLAALAEAEPPRPLSLRSHYAPGRVVLDLGIPGSGRCVVATARGWSVEDRPPEGVTFQPPGQPLPEPERGGDVDELRRVLRWAPDDPRWPLVRGWLAAALFSGVNRPVLGLFGPQGSAKSTTGRLVASVVDPKPRGVLGSGFGKNLSDDETKALGSYVVAWDNVSKVSDAGADFLSRLVTGDSIEKRRLYSDADLVKVTYRRTGIITGISVPLGIKADTLDRLVMVNLPPLQERASEHEIDAAWEAAHPRVLAGVLDMVVAALAGDRANPRGLRMADYAAVLHAVDPVLYEAYADSTADACDEMADNDPFVTTIRMWLWSRSEAEWSGTAADARAEARRHVGEDDQWWPRNGNTFMRMVRANLELLRAGGIEVEERRSGGARVKVFRRPGPSEPDAEPLL